MIPVSMQYRTDCGVAALGTVSGAGWLGACCALVDVRARGFKVAGAEGYYGVERKDMWRAARKLGLRVSRETGALLTRAPIGRGLLFVHVDCEWEIRAHWLAWERTAEHGLRVWDPAHNDWLTPGQLHAYNYRPIVWAVTSNRKNNKGEQS